MRSIIQFRIYKEDKFFVGEGIDLPIVTQGLTIDETVKNIKEALSLYLEGEDLSELGIKTNAPVLVNFELDSIYA